MIIMKKMIEDHLESHTNDNHKITLKKMLISNDQHQNKSPILSNSWFYIIVFLILFTFIWFFH